MTTDAWVFLGGTVSTLGAVVIAHISQSRKGDKVDAKVDEAVALARPTGNGFAQDVRASLAALREGQARLEAKVDANTSSIAGQAVSHARLEGKLDAHIGSHGSVAAALVPQQSTTPAP